MGEENKLTFFSDTIPYSEHSRVAHTPYSNKAFVISNDTLYEFEFSNPAQVRIRTTKDSKYPLKNSKLLFVEPLNEKQTAVIVKATEGVRIYLHSKDSLQLAVEDDQFHDSFGWNKPGNSIDFGHFYHDDNILGMMSSHLTYGTKFYAIFKDVLLSGNFPIYPLDTNYDILETYSPNSLRRSLVNLDRSSRRAIASRNSEGLSLFELNQANGIDFVLKGGPHCASDDGLFFVDLTHQKYNDIVHLNASGMFVYKYDDSYKFFHYNPLFSEEKGWTADHTKTIRFVDINDDGSVDMVFTGPTGLSAITFNEFTNLWTLLVDTSKIAPSMRHAKILHVLPKEEDTLNDTYFITHQDGRINWAKVDQLPGDALKALDVPSLPTYHVAKKDMIPIFTPKSNENKLLLRDMNIWSGILNCVDGRTGKPKFSLPLVDLQDPGVKLILNYDATSGLNDLLGIGWSMPLNLIAMDDGGSIFDEDAVFVIAFQDSMQALRYLANESSSNVRTYVLPSTNTKLKFRAKFYTDDDKWVIDLGNGIQQTYGQVVKATGQGAIAKDIVWKNWHAAGSDSDNQVERSRMWYLARVQDQRDNVLLEFFYNTDTVAVNSGLSYTNGVYLRKSRDFEGNEIEFRYEEKQTNEYRTFESKDKDGNYIWEPVQTRYLSGYTFTARSGGRQRVDFVYSTSNGNRFLKEIHQSEDVISKCVAKFDYLSLPNGKFSLQKTSLPYEVQVDLTYVPLPLGDSNMSNVQKRLDVPSDYKVTTAHNYVLVSFLNDKSPDQVVLRMFNRDMTEELYTSDSRVHVTSKGRWPLLGEYKSVVGHDVIQGDDYFAVILYYASSKWLCLFGHVPETGEWLNESNCHQYGEKADIKAGKDFCLISDPGSKLELFQWRSSWKHKILIEKTDHVPIAVYENRFVTYDNSQISLGYKTREGIWNYIKLAGIQNCLSDTENILKRFNLKQDFHHMISSVLRNNMLKFSRNLVALNCLQINGQQLSSSLKLYTIDRRNQVSVHKEIIINHDNLATFEPKEVDGGDGTFYKFKYEMQSNGDFHIKVVDFRGALEAKFATNNQRLNARKTIGKSINSPEGTQRFLLDLQNYILFLKEHTLICHDKKIIFGGNQWWQRGTVSEAEKNAETLSVTLGENFILEKANKDSRIELLQKSTRQVLSNLPVNITDVRVFYPVYMATQEVGKAVRVIGFQKDTVKEELLPMDESISPYTNTLTLITHQGGGGDGDIKTVTFRQQYGVKKFLPNHVVSQVAVVYDNDRKSRITGYEYDAGSAKLEGNRIVYSKYSIIPANYRNSYGWLDVFTKNGTSTAYNGHGEFVRHILPGERQSDDQEETEHDKAFRKATTIYDKSGRREIAKCAPYGPADESVGYYGFEDYESNVIGSSKKWNFEASNVIRNGHALTGRNYLQQKTQPIEGIFQPADQNIQYLASSWIRLQNVTQIPLVGEVTPFLKALVLTQSGDLVVSLLSQIKHRLDEWIHLELIVDLALARKQFNIESKTKLQIAIRVGPTLTTHTDIDHIRFGPLISGFNVKVYDSSTNLTSSVIRPTGAIIRRVYDSYNSVLGKINEENQLEELTVNTRAGRLTAPRCAVKVHPEMGFYEQFSPFAFANRWKIDKVQPWKIAPYQLKHYGDERDSLELHTQDVATESYGFRVLYSLDGNQASLGVNDFIELLKHGQDLTLKPHTKDQSFIPEKGEILMVKEKDRVLLWIDGDLRIDQASDIPSDRPLRISMTGHVSIKDMIVFSRPSIKVTFQNSLDEPTQEISLESSQSIIVKEKLYDELGRQRIATQHVRIPRSKSEPLLRYIPNFVTNAGTKQSNSIWKTGLLEGLAATVLGYPYCFSETQYENNPLNEKSKVTLPGKDFSSSGPFAKRFAPKMTNLFVANRYPQSMNVSYEVELKPGGLEDITVLSQQNKRIAHFVHVPGGKDLFSTYKYNADGNLLQSLPPLYFERVGSFHKTNSDLLTVNEEDYNLQKKLGVHIDYDPSGRPIRKTTPDAGPLENVYDSDNLLRFILHYSYTDPKSVETITYLTYDPLGRILTTGQLKDTHIPKDKLLSTTLNESNTVEYQLFNYGNMQREPNLRGRLKSAITMNDYVPFAEVMYVDHRGATIDKRIIVPNSRKGKPNEISISNKYSGGRLQQVSYPATFLGLPFVVVYGYDKLGRVNSVGIPGDPNRFLKISHNAAGRVTEEIYEPNSVYTFKNRRDYNEPGFLTKLSNPYLSEEISYTDSGYGGAKRGDGSVTRIKFSADWHDSSSINGVGLNPNSFVNKSMSPKDSKTCFEALKQAGYLSAKNRQLKAYFPALEHDFPIICTSGITGRHVSNVLGRLGYPHEHGYRFDYGAHQDLTKAKYFVGTDEAEPLQPHIFAKEIRGISIDASRSIWKALKEAKFLLEDPDRTNLSTSQGKESQKRFVGSNLFADLRSINPDYAFYAKPLRKLLTSRYFKRQMNVTLLQMQQIISRWLGNSSLNSKVQRTAADVFEMLRKKRYFSNPLDGEFQSALKDFKDHLPEIVRVLYTYFAKQLGHSEFDVESYEIDANGNQRMFNTGYHHYALKYEKDSNRIEGVQYRAFDSSQPEKTYRMKHDSRGNVIEALHKGIASMEYHPVSNYLQRARMVDGRIVEFYYDSKGERVLKRLRLAGGKVHKEIHYLRDDKGRSLVERELSFLADNQPPAVMITMYIYGPNGLVGFVRRDQFYSVVTDHQGSVRLIVRDGEVVSAYDYLPYGTAMRIFGADPEAHISYRYTGQEWDPELGLYNFHQRFYDPVLGRFFQIDPDEQYFSPYVYAGNSPVSMIDLDGDFAVLAFALITMVAAAYFSAAADNGTLDIREWELNKETILAALFGGATGLLLPYGLVASAGALVIATGVSTAVAYSAVVSLGLVMAYFSAAAANGTIYFRDWDWNSPQTYWALIDGFALGSGAIAGLRNIGLCYKELETSGKMLFIGITAISGTGLFVMAGKATNWDASSPQFWYAMLNVALTAADLGMLGTRATKAIAGGYRDMKLSWNLKKYIDDVFYLKSKNGRSTREAIMEVWYSNLELRGTVKFLGITSATGVFTYLIAIGLNDSPKNWNLGSVSTYQNLITAIQITGHGVSAIHDTVEARRANNKLQNAQPARLFTDDLAQRANTVYQELLEANTFDATNYENAGISKDIRQNKIPNTVLTVAVTDENAIVAFSSNEAPGLYIVYDHEKLASPQERARYHVTNNGELGLTNDGDNGQTENRLPRPVAPRDDPRLNDRIEATINANNEAIKQQNIKEYIGRAKIYALVEDMDWINEEVRNNIVDATHEEFMKNGFIETDFVKKQLDAQNQFNSGNSKITKIEQQIEQAEKVRTRVRSKPDKDAIKAKIAELKKEIRTERTNFQDLLNEQFKKFRDRFVHWSISNCGEAHALQALERHEVFLQDSLKRNWIDPQLDILYMSSYWVKKLRQIESAGAQRCQNCLVTTRLVPNVLTDNNFLADLSKTVERGQRSKDELYFLIPATSRHNSTQNKEQRKRKTRSVQPSRWYDRPVRWLKVFKNLPNPTKEATGAQSKTILELGDEFLSKITTNSTLLLADVILAKCQRRKLHQMPKDTVHELNSAELMCNVLQLFEDSLEEAANISGIPLSRIDVDLFTMQEEVLPLLRKRQLEKLADIMSKYALEGLHPEMSDATVDKFKLAFESLQVNQTMEEMLARMERVTSVDSGIDMAYNASQRMETMSNNITEGALSNNQYFIH